MDNYIITINREFGSGGREIGKKVAKKLGIECYDSRLIQIASEYGKVDLDRISYLEEQKANPLLYAVQPVTHIEKDGYSPPPNDMIFHLESAVIKEIAKRESCIIIGRCSDYVLRKHSNVHSVFIYASMEEKTKRIINRYEKFDEKKAAALIKRVDKKRGAYYNYYTNKKWDDKESYDLCLNSGKLGIDDCALLLEHFKK